MPQAPFNRKTLPSQGLVWPFVTCPHVGAETGDGRDESNKSLQERLADAQNAQTAADAECKAADIKQKHLSKQAAEQRKSLASKDKEATGLRQALDKAQQQVDKCRQQLQVSGSGQACIQHSFCASQQLIVE